MTDNQDINPVEIFDETESFYPSCCGKNCVFLAQSIFKSVKMEDIVIDNDNDRRIVFFCLFIKVLHCESQDIPIEFILTSWILIAILPLTNNYTINKVCRNYHPQYLLCQLYMLCFKAYSTVLLFPDSQHEQKEDNYFISSPLNNKEFFVHVAFCFKENVPNQGAGSLSTYQMKARCSRSIRQVLMSVEAYLLSAMT